MKKEEQIIKSKARVKQHGEVFTPKNIVNDMINLPGLKDCIKDCKTTVLEPACGEGVFLIEILKKRLKEIEKSCDKDIVIYENLALLSLTTLYGIELLEDNAQKCVINIYETFMDYYNDFASKNGKKMKIKVLDSAKTIITSNIVEGNFLTKQTTNGNPIVFSEWRIVEPKSKNKKIKNIIVERTEFTLEEIMNEEAHDSGKIYGDSKRNEAEYEQITLFDLFEPEQIIPDYEEPEKKVYRYKKVRLVDVRNEEMEEISDGN